MITVLVTGGLSLIKVSSQVRECHSSNNPTLQCRQKLVPTEYNDRKGEKEEERKGGRKEKGEGKKRGSNERCN